MEVQVVSAQCDSHVCWHVTLKGGEEWKELRKLESEMFYYVAQCENSYENT